MSRSHQYINTFYLVVHFAINILVIAVIVDLIDTYVPLKHLWMGYHVDIHNFYARIDLQKSIAPIVAAGLAVWYYKRSKAKANDDITHGH